jgi:polysaccharide chain length determinant protein (PEP-CTERM system associated)
MTDEPRPTSPFESARAIWQRRKGMAILAIVLPVAAVVGLTAFLPNVYQSTALVLIERQQVPEAYVKSAVTSEVESRLQAISQDVLSRVRLEALIDRFKLYPELSGQERVSRMRKDTELELKSIERKGQPEGITSAFTISYRGRDPRTVAEVTNTLASFFVEQNVQIRERLAQGTSGFLKVQLDGTKAQLDKLERQVGEFKKRYIGQLPEQLPANLAILEQLHAQLRINSINQTRASERRAMRVESPEEAAGPLGPGAGPERVAARLARLRGELAQMRTQYSDKYPDVRGLKAEVSALEERLAAEPPARPGAPRRGRADGEIDAELSTLRAEEKRLRDANAVYQHRVENTPTHEQAYRVLARDYDTTREHYASLLKRYEEAQLAENLEVVKKGEQFRIVETALPADEPVAPNRVRLALVGLGLAIGMAGLAVVLAEQSDTSFHSVADVRAFTAVPVVAGIPQIVRARDRRARRVRRGWAVAGACAATVLVVLVTYLVADGNVSLVWLLTRGKA